MNKKSILFINIYSSGGGAERVLTHLANQFALDGNDVVYCSLYNNGYYDLEETVRRLVINQDRKMSPLAEIMAIRRLLKAHAFDAVIAFGFAISTKLALATIGMKCRKKIIMSERNDPARNINSRLKELLRNYAYSCAAKLVFQTEDAKKYFSVSIQKKGTIILNPIFVHENTSHIQHDENRIIAAGRIAVQKNFSLLLNAFAKFIQDYPDYYLDIFGAAIDNNELEKLQCLVKNKGIDHKVSFKGFSDNIVDEYYGSSIYVSSSDYEGISNSMLEAMACGLAVICTDCPCGGAKMAIEHQKNGWLTPVKDEEALYQGLVYMASHPDERRKMAAEAVKIRERLSANQIYHEWMKVVESL